MRVKDDAKQEALFLATINRVNEIGFAASSVSKIAKEAGVSPATLYIYFKNKEDLILSTYLEIKHDMSNHILGDLDNSLPVRDILHGIWCRSFSYITENLEEFRFTEQFANSPYSELVNKETVESYFAPLFAVIQRGIDQKIIKNVHFDILKTFMFSPVMILANPAYTSTLDMTDANIETAFQMSWDAIKL